MYRKFYVLFAVLLMFAFTANMVFAAASAAPVPAGKKITTTKSAASHEVAAKSKATAQPKTTISKNAHKRWSLKRWWRKPWFHKKSKAVAKATAKPVKP